MKKPIPYQVHEITDPVPMKTSVRFKRPLSAHERVNRAIKMFARQQQLDAQPGDDTFDAPPHEGLAAHQLMIDPESGQEITAAEYTMLQEERQIAHEQLQKAKEDFIAANPERYAPKKPKKGAKAPKPTQAESEEDESIEDDN